MKKEMFLTVIFSIVLCSCQTRSEIAIQDETENSTVATDIKKQYEMIGKKLYDELLSNDEYLIDYKINHVEFKRAKIDELDHPPELRWFQPEETDSAFMVMVIYSVKPTKSGYNLWLAGNGKVANNGWIVRKIAAVFIDKCDEEYCIKREGTGP